MAISVVGFDVGSLTSYVGVVKGGGIEILTNEYSDRQTPSCVAFTGRSRMMGFAAKQQHITNMKNTVVNFKQFVGKKMSDPAVSLETKYIASRIEAGPDDRVTFRIDAHDGSYTFTPEQIMAMQLTKLKQITETALCSKVVDVTINVPTYFTDTERRSILDASRIAGLNCVKLVNDLAAVGTAYGLYNTDLPPVDQSPKIVAFVCVGYTSTQVALCAFNAGKMKILSTACDSLLGGRDFDFVVFNKLADEFEAKFNLDVRKNNRATLRLLSECEKVKKAMSANAQELPVNVECLMDDRDLISRMKRPDFEELAADLLLRFEQTLLKSLSSASLQPNDVHSVELVGGSSRIPALKSIVKSVFKQDCRTTLNADEAVARGCALQAAICSPAYKVREFVVTDACPYAITLHWDQNEGGDQSLSMAAENEGELSIEGRDTSVEVFPLFHHIPSSRRLFFYRRGPFSLQARYSQPETVPNQNVVLGTFKINNVPQQNEVSKIRVKVRVNAHGIFSISQAELAEEYEKEVEVPDESGEPVVTPQTTPNAATEAMEVETPSNGDAPAATASVEEEKKRAAKPAATKMVKKKAVRYTDLPIDSCIMQYTVQQINAFFEIEGKLHEQDELEHKRANAKNAVEEYVYEMRSKLQDALNSFASAQEQSRLSQMLDETEDWLYGDGEDLHRQAYVDRLNQMKVFGDPIQFRATEQETRKSAVQQFERYIVHVRKVLDSAAKGEEAYDHLSTEQLGQLQSYLKQHEDWLRQQLRLQQSKALTEDPCVTTKDIDSHRQAMENLCNPIINTPKPVAPPPAPPTDTTNSNDSKNGNTNSTKSATKTNTVSNGDLPNDKSTKVGSDAAAVDSMDVD